MFTNQFHIITIFLTVQSVNSNWNCW